MSKVIRISAESEKILEELKKLIEDYYLDLGFEIKIKYDDVIKNALKTEYQIRERK